MDSISVLVIAMFTVERNVGSYGSASRMTSTLHILRIIRPIQALAANSRETKLLKICNVTLFVIKCVLNVVITNTFVFIAYYKTFFPTNPASYSLLFIVVLDTLISFFLEEQMIFVCHRIEDAYKVLVQKLQVLSKINEHSYLQKLSASKNLRDISKDYSILYNASMFYANEIGLIMFLSFGFLISLLIGVVYHTRVSFFINAKVTGACFAWLVFLTVRVIQVIEPFHGIRKQIHKMKEAVSHLAFKLTDCGEKIPLELNTHIRQLETLRPQFKPLGAFTINRSLFIKVYGAIVTYGTIMLNPKNHEIKNFFSQK